MRSTKALLARIALAVLVLSVFCAGRLAGEADGKAHDDAPDTRLVDSAQTSQELNDAYASLLGDSHPELLGKLQAGDCTGVALQAAWEELKQSMPRSPASPVRSRRFGRHRLDRVALARFIGFVEGRLRVQAPDWWEDDLCGAQGDILDGSGVLHLSIRDTDRGDYHSTSVTSGARKFDVRRGGEVSGVEVIRDQLVVHLDAVVFQVTRPFGDPFYVSGSRYGASNCLVLVNDAMPKGTLLNVDLAEGKVVWERKLWCDHAPYIRSGGGFFHWSEVQVKDTTAFVFGLCNDIVYIEAFELPKGHPLFRFSTTYGWRVSGR